MRYALGGARKRRNIGSEDGKQKWRVATKVARKTDATVSFIESMECLAVPVLPKGPGWTYEIKLDGFRLEAIRDAGAVRLYSRRANVLNEKFPRIVEALSKLPKSTVLDGEVVALDADSKSNFSLLQNFRSAETQIHYYAFDILALKGKSLLQAPLEERRSILGEILPVSDRKRLLNTPS